ncbi:MAG: LamG-like jellyroll fold domain-containing protein [Bacteroidales bacterium]|jgi:hypothetical protein|nr:LamG-like jellyroll fold domain-containing protein [Bacteroidales bacterium]
MKKILPVFILALMIFTSAAQDTIVVQTLTFDSITTRRGTWLFPEGESFRKILMYHTLKCDYATTHDQYACGEWDYLTYNIVYRHTGAYDSTLYHHPNFTLVEGTAPDSLLLTSSPTYNYFLNRHYNVVFPDTLSFTQATIGNPAVENDKVIPAGHKAGRAQYLWKASELLSQSLEAGLLTGLKLNLAEGSNGSGDFMIRMKQVSLDELTPDTLIAGLDTVFQDRTSFSTGWNDFNFYRPFDWDGVSDIVVEFCYTGSGSSGEVMARAQDPGFNCGISSAGDNYVLDLDGVSDFLKLQPGIYFNSDFTFETWFYKRNNNNWSRIFDFGNGPDRQNVIVALSTGTSGRLSFHVFMDGQNRSFELDNPTPLNEWTHLAVRLTAHIAWVYINGNLVKLGLLQQPPNLERSINYIGRSNWNGDQAADVLLDEFRLWKTALDPATIKSHFRKGIADPAADTNLVFYYDFDEGSGIILHDRSSHSHNAEGFGRPGFYPLRGPEVNMGFEQDNNRPNIIFERIVSSAIDVSEETVIDSLADAPLQIVRFSDPDNPTVPTDTIERWVAGFKPVYENWIVVDSVWTAPEEVIRKEMIPYYGEPFEVLEEFEIGRFITPYGIGLTLGDNGFTWVYDVTDYAPLLQGMVDLSAGNQQELIDLKFMLIKGTPPREVKQIDRIWGGLRSFYYKDLDDDLQMSAVTLPLRPDASQFRVKTRLTGHGHNSNTGEYPHCCEWKDNEHYLRVNGQQAGAWHIFQYHDCSLNPVFPQGGTWSGAREGWCPGDLVKDHDFEITDFITGSQVTIDYDITPVPEDNLGMGWGNYVTNMDLVQYGENHFNVDAEVYNVITPSNVGYYSRVNPVCYGLKALLRNNGSAPLTSAKFSYGVSGGPQETFDWSGSLQPHTIDTVDLPVSGDLFWIGDENHTFTVTVSEPNGTADQYLANDAYRSKFNMPDLIDIPIVLKLKTNNQAYRFSLEVRDIAGSIILERDTLENNTIYLDTLDLPYGCYTIELTDIEDIGLSYWAYPEQGSGYFRIYDLDGHMIKSFNSEFGRTIFYTYHVGEGFYIGEPGFDPLVKIYPNPTDGIVNVDVNDNSGEYLLNIFNMQGMLIRSEWIGSGQMVYDLTEYPSGLYLFECKSSGFSVIKKIIKR